MRNLAVCKVYPGHAAACVDGRDGRSGSVGYGADADRHRSQSSRIIDRYIPSALLVILSLVRPPVKPARTQPRLRMLHILPPSGDGGKA